MAEALSALGKLRQSYSDLEQAEAAFKEALAILEKIPSDTAGYVAALRSLAWLYDAAGQTERPFR